MTAVFEEPDPFTEEVELLHCAAAELPRLLDAAVDGVAEFARGIADLVGNLDGRRAELNQLAPRSGHRPVPDLMAAAVPARDRERSQLLAAARRGPAHAAVALAKAARRPACQPAPEMDLQGAQAVMDEAAQAASAVLSWQHHAATEVGLRTVIGDADPFEVAGLLAGIVLNLAAEVVPDVGAWLVEVGAQWAPDGE